MTGELFKVGAGLVGGFLGGMALSYYFWIKPSAPKKQEKNPIVVIPQSDEVEMDEVTSTESYDITEKNRVKRLKKRGSYEKQTIYKILDAGFLCHVSFIRKEGDEIFPVVLPMLYGRTGDHIYLHGHTSNKMLKTIETGGPVCIEVTLLDGLVYARSLFHSSANYRSVTLFGTARTIENPDDKMRALQIVSDNAMPGRWDDARIPNKSELQSTRVLEVTIENAASKIRTGPPIDDKDDLSLGIWAGVLPISQVTQPVISDLDTPPTMKVPDYITKHPKLRVGI